MFLVIVYARRYFSPVKGSNSDRLSGTYILTVL
jgi:hypothetical protein